MSNKRSSKPAPEPELPRGLQIADLVRYYDEGWRYGHLDLVEHGKARIRPVAAYGSCPRKVWIPVEDVFPTEKGDSAITEL